MFAIICNTLIITHTRHTPYTQMGVLGEASVGCFHHLPTNACACENSIFTWREVTFYNLEPPLRNPEPLHKNLEPPLGQLEAPLEQQNYGIRCRRCVRCILFLINPILFVMQHLEYLTVGIVNSLTIDRLQVYFSSPFMGMPHTTTYDFQRYI